MDLCHQKFVTFVQIRNFLFSGCEPRECKSHESYSEKSSELISKLLRTKHFLMIPLGGTCQCDKAMTNIYSLK